MISGLMSSVHAEYVVQENGSYVTMLMQTGTITAVDSTTATVKSADGVSYDYALDSSTTVTKQSAKQGGQQSSQQGPPGAASTTQAALSDMTVGSTVQITAKKGASSNAAQTVTLQAAS